MRLISFKALIMLGMIGLMFTACQKDDHKVSKNMDVEATAQGVSKNDLIAADLFEQINIISRSNPSLIDESAKTKAVEGFGDDILDHLENYSCAKVKVDVKNIFLGWPKVVTVDYGAGGCEDPKTKKLRKGKIILTYNKAWLALGCEVTVKFEDYWCGDTKFDGFCKVTSTGITTKGNLKFTLECEGTKIHCDCVERWSCKKEIEWCNNGTLLNIFDDYYSITGHGEGSDNKGNYFTETIKVALIKKAFCPWISKGTIELSSSKSPLCTFDYGVGECDAKATLTINGNTKQIDL